MGRIQTEIDRPATALVNALAELPTAVLADVSEGPVVIGEGIRPIGEETLCGPAITVRAPPGDNRAVHQALTLANAGDVIVIDADGYSNAGIWGELLSRSAMSHELAGTVVDGAVRDVASIRHLEYPVFTRSINPAGTAKRRKGSINTTVSCGQQTVRPGSVIVGDSDGVVSIDLSRAESVIESATAKLEREQSLGNRIDNGEYLYEILDLTYED